MKLRHYYHLYADGNYRKIVRQHFAALIATDLIGHLDHLHVGIVGSDENVAEARKWVGKQTRRKFTTSSAPSGWEQETQDVLYRDAVEAKEPFLALYAHTKGASSQTEINEHWRTLMTRYTVNRWKNAVATIKGNIGAAGSFWAPFDNGRQVGRPEGTQYFAGTFWWARSDALAQIGPPERDDRFGAERWIGKITKPPLNFGVAKLFDAQLTVETLRHYAEM
jgi:hypothetical protein